MNKTRAMVRATAWMIALVMVGVAATGCNTVQGVGEDIQAAGEAGERAISGD